MKIIKHRQYPGMYWVQWPDKVKSVDYYNLTWAKEHCAGEVEKGSPTARR